MMKQSRPNPQFPILLPKDNIAIYIGSIAGAFRQLIMQIALKFTPARNAGIIQPSVPIATALLGQCLGIENVSMITYLSIFISAIGLFVSMDITIINTGVLLLLSVPFAKAIQVISLKVASNKLDNHILHIYQILILVGVSLPIAILYQILDGSFISIFYITFLQASCILYSTISVVYIAWKIQIIGIKIIGPTRVSLFQVVQPFLTIFLEYLLLDEEITIKIFIGTLIVVVALAIQILANDQIDPRHENHDMRTRLLENT